MGHERVGILPRRKRWHDIAREIHAALNGTPADTATLASGVLQEVRGRYRRLPQDSGVQAAFGYLVALATQNENTGVGFASATIDLHNNPSPARITAQLAEWVKTHAASPEYAELASRAAADAIAMWTRKNTRQQLLFDDQTHAINIWGNVDGKGFCEVARTFFAKLTDRYLRYFIERSASAEAPSLEARQRLGRTLSSQMEDVSQHAFETSKITQSFAAGWFNKHAREGSPTDLELSHFLAHAFGKLQEELSRESPGK